MIRTWTVLKNMGGETEGIFTAICPFRPRRKEKAMKKYEEELKKYCDEQMEFKFADERQRKEWIFGAVEFAKRSGLIDGETSKELLEKYRAM